MCTRHARAFLYIILCFVLLSETIRYDNVDFIIVDAHDESEGGTISVEMEGGE